MWSYIGFIANVFGSVRKGLTLVNWFHEAGCEAPEKTKGVVFMVVPSRKRPRVTCCRRLVAKVWRFSKAMVSFSGGANEIQQAHGKRSVLYITGLCLHNYIIGKKERSCVHHLCSWSCVRSSALPCFNKNVWRRSLSMTLPCSFQKRFGPTPKFAQLGDKRWQCPSSHRVQCANSYHPTWMATKLARCWQRSTAQGRNLGSSPNWFWGHQSISQYRAPSTVLAWGDACMAWSKKAYTQFRSVPNAGTKKLRKDNLTQVEILRIVVSWSQCQTASTNQRCQRGQTFQWHPKYRSTSRPTLDWKKSKIWHGKHCWHWCEIADKDHYTWPCHTLHTSGGFTETWKRLPSARKQSPTVLGQPKILMAIPRLWGIQKHLAKSVKRWLNSHAPHWKSLGWCHLTSLWV